MIRPEFFIEALREKGIDCFAGVPDSLLKNICAYITDHFDAEHILETTRCQEASEQYCMPIKQILNLIPGTKKK